jgi:tetratricopeptide (TPR) repeat protein
MASLIPGYNYDIFISYRQKDNKHDGWVTKFVDNLKGEIEATFKEDVSVYFDENPHDRLQETHNVDKSLEGKLKCLIFIPILSQTYCDPNSYAWQYEFLAFLRMAEKDSFGKDIKLRSGNVASRILPIRIHDLEPEDVKLFEKETGSVLRALDFVFKTSTGVSRPLKASEDHPNDNLNKTYYHDQINKVALAIKEIILGLKTTPTLDTKGKTEHAGLFEQVTTEEQQIKKEELTKTGKIKLLSGITVLAVLIIAALFLYPKIFKRDKLGYLREKGDISIVVMPFQNMTNDTTKNFWQEMIQDNLITSLSNSEELKVRQTEAINSFFENKDIANYAAISPSVAGKISQKLNANLFICGSINQEGGKIRLNAQLIDSKTGEIFKPFKIEGSSERDNILDIVDLLSREIKNFLTISQLKQKELPDFRQYETTNSPDAYRNYLSGMNAFGKGNFATARERFSLAVQNDSNFTLATVMLSKAYLNLGLFKEGKELCLKAYEKRNQMTMYMRINLDDLHAWYTEGPQGRLRYLRQLLDLDNQDPMTYYNLGNSYRTLGQYDKAIPEFKKSLDIYKKWGVKPTWVFDYNNLGFSYHKTGQYKKEKKLYKKAELDFPNAGGIPYRQAILSLTEGDTIAANKYIEKYISILKDNASSEAAITTNLASIYSDVDILDKAEEYYRHALSLEPDSLLRLNNLAYFLIDKNRNVNEGLQLADQALKLKPDNSNSLHIKGWGLYKQNKYKEALKLLVKSDSLKSFYNNSLYLHLEAAKKAVASQKNN